MPRHDSPEVEPNRIYVGRINTDISRHEIHAAFSKFGEISDLLYNNNGFAFVRYRDEGAAQDAVE